MTYSGSKPERASHSVNDASGVVRHDRPMPEKQVPLRATFDTEADAAYIYLADEPALGWRHGKTIPVDSDEIGGMVNIDVDDDGRLIGIEVLEARRLLSDKILAALDRG